MTDTREFCPHCNKPKHFVGNGEFVCPQHPEPEQKTRPVVEDTRKTRRRISTP